MSNQGWHGLEYSTPTDPSDFIVWAKLDTVQAAYKKSGTFATPESGNWTPPLPALADPVSLDYTNPTYRADISYIKDSVTVQSKFSNIATAPLAVRDLIFYVGNERGRTDWKMRIPINFGASTYDVAEMSILENVATKGDVQGKYPVLDFGTAGFTGSKNLDIIFSGFFGPLNLGIHLEKNNNLESSILIIRAIVFPIEVGFQCFQSSNVQ